MSAHFDVFNGDADGLCALHQFRLAYPTHSTLVSGTKRDIALLQHVHASKGDHVAVFDISLDRNAEALQILLDQGVEVHYYDHHAASKRFAHPRLHWHWDEHPEICTALLVDRHLGGRYQLWAIVAAFGDNLPEVGVMLARRRGLSETQCAALQRLGVLLNYNAYGEDVTDLYFDPVQLYRAMQPFTSPFDCIADTDFYSVLDAAYDADCAEIGKLQPRWQQSSGMIYVLPNQRWARRMSGMLANRLSLEHRNLSFAVLMQKENGDYSVSVRSASPERKPAHTFCSAFPGGGGRRSAAGINELQGASLKEFSDRFFSYF